MIKNFSGAMRQVREADPTLLRLNLIGQMDARTLSGASVLPVGGKTRALLAILALSERKPVLRSRLAELLWSRRPEELARASLRQEIHRLLDALSSLGVDIIDVQRHSLSLKPVLTSVDVERVMTTSVRTMDGLPAFEDVLLGELSGIDPALDEWLEQQRKRLSDHLLGLYENCLREMTDPEQIDDVTSHLLKMAPLNEAAWRAKIQTALRQGAQAKAVSFAEQAQQVFQQHDDYVPGAVTLDLISSVLDVTSGKRSSEGLVAGSDKAGASSLERLAAKTVVSPKKISRIDPMLEVPLSLLPAAVSQSRKIALLIQAPFSFEGMSEREREASFVFNDHIELHFVDSATFDNVAKPEGFIPDQTDPCASYRALGADYVVTGVVRSSSVGEGQRLILKVLDVRAGGVIVWGAYHDVEFGDHEALSRGISGPINAMQWALILAEGRRISGRSDAELSVLGRAARAFKYLLKNDGSLFDRIDTLLAPTKADDAQESTILHIRGLYALVRFQNDWSDAGFEVLQDGISTLQDLMRLYAGSADLYALLMAGILMHDRASLPVARSMLKMSHKAFMVGTYENSPEHTLAKAMIAILENDYEAALPFLEILRRNPYNSPLYTLFRPCFMMIMMLGGKVQEAVDMGRLIAGLHPNYAGGLIFYLAALMNEDGDKDEIEHVKTHLLRLVPDLTIARILERFPYINDARTARLTDVFQRAGFA